MLNSDQSVCPFSGHTHIHIYSPLKTSDGDQRREGYRGRKFLVLNGVGRVGGECSIVTDINFGLGHSDYFASTQILQPRTENSTKSFVRCIN